MRVILNVLLAHCGGSYIAVALAMPIFVWFGTHDYLGMLAVSAIAPLSLPAMAVESVSHVPDWRMMHLGLLMLLPPYVLGFVFTLRVFRERAWRRQRQARIAAGLCGACGYDLAGNTSGICPECGRGTSRS